MAGVEHIHLPFFGRKAELAKLRERVAHPGLTVVKGPPRIGKTRLLQVFAGEIREFNATFLGMATASGASGDVLLRAVADAYDQWLRDASALDQLRTIWKQQKDGLIGRAGEAIGKVVGATVEEAGKWTFIPGSKAVGTLLQEGFSAARYADEKLRSGGLAFQPLQADEARSLLEITAHATDEPVILILNQWEEGRELQNDADTLRTFVREFRSWPAIHVILHLRDPRREDDRNQDADSIATGLVDLAGAGLARLLHIAPIDFERDDEARRSLFEFLHEHIPGLAELDEPAILKIIAGNPAVLDQWTLPSLDRTDLKAIISAAEDAHKYRHPDVSSALHGLLPPTGSPESDRAALHVALRFAVSPALTSTTWHVVKKQILAGARDFILADLESSGFLLPSEDSTPNMGHPTRHSAARSTALTDDALLPHTRRALQSFANALADDADVEAGLHGDEGTRTRHGLLAALSEPLSQSKSSPLVCALAGAASTLFSKPWAESRPRLNAELLRSATAPQRSLLASGLFNAFNHSGTDRARADALLGELRELSSSHPEEAPVRGVLAKGLFNAFNHSDTDHARADALLGELRELSSSHPEEAPVREQLASGLTNAIYHAGTDHARADALLGELRELSSSHPEEAPVREQLAKGLFNAFNNAKISHGRSIRTLDEMVALLETNPNANEIMEPAGRFAKEAGRRAQTAVEPWASQYQDRARTITRLLYDRLH